MHIIIHRGSREIGGTCIQLSTDRTTILLDLGQPLSKESRLIDFTDIKADAVLISHPHQDHYGLIDVIDKNIPVYIGELGKNLIDATRVLIHKNLHNNKFNFIKSRKPLTIGDFTVTPYLVDHSAVDAYSFLIEAQGKRVFYSGDFRAHGRKSSLFEHIIKNPPKNIDLLFMEGTMMRRDNDEFPTEESVEAKILETIRNQENISFLISSSQNIDRIVSAYRACLKAGKILVIDFYTAWVLEQLKKVTKNVPAMDWEMMRVYADYGQDRTVKDNQEFFGDFRKRVYRYRVKPEELKANPARYLYMTRVSKHQRIKSYRGDKPVNVIYSQWLGYLECTNKEYPGAEAITNIREGGRGQFNFIYAHTSGHATVADLQRFAGALKPKMLVPIHTEHGERFKEYFENVKMIKDKEIFLL